MSKLKEIYRQRQLHWMVLPGVAFMIVFNYIPIYGIIIAFKNYTVIDTISSAPWVGLENFRIILHDSFFLGSSWEYVSNQYDEVRLRLCDSNYSRHYDF